MEEKTLAFEMLQELKRQSKRKDIIIVILIGVILSMIIFYFYHESQFETIGTEEQYIEDISDSSNSNYIQTIN